MDVGEPIAGVAEKRSPGEELVEGVLAVHRVAAAEAVLVLEVGGRDDMSGDDPVLETGCMNFERADRRFCQPVARRVVPVPVPEVARGVLEQRRDDVRAFRGERLVPKRRDRRLEVGALGDSAVLRVVERQLELVEAGRDHDSPV